MLLRETEAKISRHQCSLSGNCRCSPDRRLLLFQKKSVIDQKKKKKKVSLLQYTNN